MTLVERTIEIERSADQAQVCKGLWEVSQRFTTCARLLAVKAKVIGVPEHLLEHESRIFQPL